MYFFFSGRRRHTRCLSDWSSDVCSSDLAPSGRGDDWTSACQGSSGVSCSSKSSPRVELRDAFAEIGRASCRERVDIWVVGVSQKKKTEASDTAESDDNKAVL